jgi:hypothetical protein
VKRRAIVPTEKKTAPKKKAAVKKAVAAKKPPAKKKQPDLPGMEDRAESGLEALVDEYKEAGQRKSSAAEYEKACMADVRAEMKRLGKKRYHRDGITVELEPVEDKVKVTVKDTVPEHSPADGMTEEAETAEAGA